MKNFFFGLSTYRQALNYIFRKKIGWYFIFPLLINILIFVAGFELIDSIEQSTKDYIFNLMGFNKAELADAAWYIKAMSTSVSVIFKIAFFFIFAYFGGYIVIIIMSPVFSFLSEHVEKIHTGKTYDFNFVQLIKDIFRGIRIAVRNILIELFLTVILFFVSFIPVIGLIAPVLLFFISAYFYGFSFMDYALERKRISVKKSVRFMSINKGIVIGNGFVFALCLLIPFFGVLLSSFAAIVSVVAATIAVDELWKKNDFYEILN
ncbi:MAG: EI24 domain-containing protein [Marinifilaceae bacterium]|jgi:CysZ protein|nr:EI24 domain-containing protein [Marinifilaceae bacterium]